MTPEDKEELKIATNKLIAEEKRIRLKFVHFRNISVLSILLLFSFVHNYYTFILDLNILCFSLFLAFILFFLFMLLVTYAAYDNWKFTKGILNSYEMSDEEFMKQFEKFCREN